MQPPQQGQDPYNSPREPESASRGNTDNLPPHLLRQVTELSEAERQARDRYLMAPPETRQQALPARAADAGLAALAHFLIALGFLGVGFIASIGINIFLWLYSKRSPHVAYHAKQAGSYQCFVLLFNIFYVVMLLVLGVLFAPQVWQDMFSGTPGRQNWSWAGAILFVMALLWAVWFVLSILYGVYAGVMVLLGREFRYPYFGRTKT